LVTFFAAAKKVTAAPHRGNACAAKARREGATPMPPQKQKTERHRLRREGTTRMPPQKQKPNGNARAAKAKTQTPTPNPL
jgi:hypothetical protein